MGSSRKNFSTSARVTDRRRVSQGLNWHRKGEANAPPKEESIRDYHH